MAEDWRLNIDLDGTAQAEHLAERLESSELERDVHDRLGQRIVVSQDGPQVFLYADSEAAAREAEGVVSSLIRDEGWPATTVLTRWHPDAEEWRPASEPLPQTDEERRAEREQRLADERRDTSQEGYAQWEVQVELPSHRAARELSQRLEQEGVPHVRRWRYVFVGATDEDAARQWGERLSTEAPAGSRVSVDGTFASIERHNPFAIFSGPSGGP